MRGLYYDGKLTFRTDLPEPVPDKGSALVRVSMAGICATDIEITKGYMGFKGIPGHEFAGVVEECENERLVGRRVAGEINIGCGKCKWCREKIQNHCPDRTVLGILGKDGAFAEFLTLPVKNLHPLPDSITDEEAVFSEPLAAVHGILEEVKINEYKKVCVLGDGRLGLLCALVLALTDCVLVAVGRHEEKLALLKKLGINAVVGSDGLERDFDVVVDCTGSPEGFNEAMGLVKPRGTIVLKTTTAGKGAISLNGVVIDEITVKGSRCGPFKPAIDALEQRKVDVRPLISAVYPLEDGVEAFKRAGEKNVVKVLVRP